MKFDTGAAIVGGLIVTVLVGPPLVKIGLTNILSIIMMAACVCVVLLVVYDAMNDHTKNTLEEKQRVRRVFSVVLQTLAVSVDNNPIRRIIMLKEIFVMFVAPLAAAAALPTVAVVGTAAAAATAAGGVYATVKVAKKIKKIRGNKK